MDEDIELNNTTIPGDRGISSVATRSKHHYVFMAIFFLLALAAMAVVVRNGMHKNTPRSLIEPEEIAFKSPGGNSTPYIVPDPVIDHPGVASAPSAPAPPAYDAVAAQREIALQQEALRMAKEQQKHLEERLRSPQLIYDQNSGQAAANVTVTKSGPNSLLSGGQNDENVSFANQQKDQDVETAQASQLGNLDTLIPQGTMIAGILETAIQSDLPGMVRAVVSENVYAFDGNAVLIPKGSRLIGQYRSGLVRGQTRVFVIWNRMLRSDGVSVNIGSTGTDALGRSGLEGDVDTHFFERFGSSILLSMIDSGLQAGVNALDNKDTATVALDSGKDFLKSAEIALQNSVAIPPTINVNQGVRINVFVGKDLDFSQVGGNLPRKAGG